MLPVYTRMLTPADFGALQLIEITVEIISIIAGSRLAAGIFHYYHKAATDEGRRIVLPTAFVVLARTGRRPERHISSRTRLRRWLLGLAILPA